MWFGPLFFANTEGIAVKHILSEFQHTPAGTHPLGDSVCEAMAHWTAFNLTKLEERLTAQWRIRPGRVEGEARNDFLDRIIALEKALDELNGALETLRLRIDTHAAQAQAHNSRLVRLEAPPLEPNDRP
jgi:hypothetical protein